MFVAACVVAVLVTKKLPEVFAEAEFAKRGEESPSATARRERLAAAGIDPATGGAARQFFSNLWRDAWLDLDKARRDRRAATNSKLDSNSADDQDGAVGGKLLVRRLADRVDAAIDRKVAAWRARPDSGGALGDDRNKPGEGPSPSAPPEPATGPDTTDEPPQAPTGSWRPDPAPTDTEPGTWHADSEPPPFQPPTGTPPPAARPPIKATLVREPAGEPDRMPSAVATAQRPAIEGAPAMSSIVRAGSVTGVVSGAAEARAIGRALEAANAEYVAALSRIRSRIHALGEQSLSNVQLATRSRIISLTLQAAESAAAAQAAAKHCGSEVPPLLGAVAREFDRLNS